MNSKPIYLDYMATTPIDPQVIERMLAFMGPNVEFGNPASTTHVYGEVAAKAVEQARYQIAESIGAASEEIIFTSGATEANNLALFGGARFYQIKGRHIITLATEHKSVLDCMKQLEREGFEVTYLLPKENGLLDLPDLEQALRVDTILVSVMHVNNEIGVIQDIQEIAHLLRGKGILFHVDAAQSAGKLDINLREMPIDLMSFSAHKVYGPKGIGALYVRQKPRVRLRPILFGGGHENGLRSGTLPTHQIIGMGEAFAMANALREAEQERIKELRNRLWRGICNLPHIKLNGDFERRIAGNLNLTLGNIEASKLLPAMSHLALSTTSACMSSRADVSHVLLALGFSHSRILSSFRLSIGRYTTIEEIDETIRIICNAAKQFEES